MKLSSLVDESGIDESKARLDRKSKARWREAFCLQKRRNFMGKHVIDQGRPAH
jgi:hypothetical protein